MQKTHNTRNCLDGHRSIQDQMHLLDENEIEYLKF